MNCDLLSVKLEEFQFLKFINSENYKDLLSLSKISIPNNFNNINN
jgi:hypothetical protein